MKNRKKKKRRAENQCIVNRKRKMKRVWQCEWVLNLRRVLFRAVGFDRVGESEKMRVKEFMSMDGGDGGNRIRASNC